MGEPDDVEQHDAERAVRVELARVDAELVSIPSDRFAERSPLLKRRHELSDELRAAVAADPETLARWAERAGSKETGDGSKPYIPSPMESGSM